MTRLAVFASIALSATMLTACGGGEPAPAPTATSTPAPTATAAPAPTPTETATPTAAATPTPAAADEDAIDLSALPAPYNTADYDQGRRQFAKCRACHLIDAEGGHRVGPNLNGIFQRKSGVAEGFKYSDALAEADFDWTPEQLDQWLANPKQFLPGNRMVFAGIAKQEQRENLIAYLLVETEK